MKQKEAMELVAALRSGEYIQGYCQLKISNTYCCLGVACIVAGGNFDGEFCDHERLNPSEAIRGYFDFYSTEGRRRDNKSLLINGCEFVSLENANDSRFISFNAIADYIEQNWEQL